MVGDVTIIPTHEHLTLVNGVLMCESKRTNRLENEDVVIYVYKRVDYLDYELPYVVEVNDKKIDNWYEWEFATYEDALSAAVTEYNFDIRSTV